MVARTSRPEGWPAADNGGRTCQGQSEMARTGPLGSSGTEIYGLVLSFWLCCSSRDTVAGCTLNSRAA